MRVPRNIQSLRRRYQMIKLFVVALLVTVLVILLGLGWFVLSYAISGGIPTGERSVRVSKEVLNIGPPKAWRGFISTDKNFNSAKQNNQA